MNTDCRAIRKNILTCSQISGHGHIPTSFSIVEMLYAVYSTMRHQPSNPHWPERDIFVLSKGHASLGFYCVLSHFGYFGIDEVKTFGAFQTRFGCHPDRLKAPGAEVSTGSLGHGIGVAVGMALGIKLRKQSRQVYTLIGDGESNEGTVWEAVMVATDQKLGNLTILYDHNQSQIRCLQIHNPAERFKAFGCDVFEVDGHNTEQLQAALVASQQQVKVIVCHTSKGFGCSSLTEDMFAWHRRSPKPDELQQLMEELDASAI